MFIGLRRQEHFRIDAFSYSSETLEEANDIRLEDCRTLFSPNKVCWINFNGVHAVEQVKSLTSIFKLHPLTAEDIVNTAQRPKIERFDDYVYIVLKMVTPIPGSCEIESEHVSLILGKGFVLSFQEKDGDVFDAVRGRLRAGKGRMRRCGADYLAYALMDAVIDRYFSAIESVGEQTDSLGEQIETEPASGHLPEMNRLRKLLLQLRRALWPLREEISAMSRGDLELIEEGTLPFLRDIHDHTIQAMEMVETQREILGGLHDIYLAGISLKMNEVMKTLTIIATIFIPLTFIVGIYGMNFEYMPELEWTGAYFVVLGGMALIAGGMLWSFRRRGWL